MMESLILMENKTNIGENKMAVIKVNMRLNIVNK